MWLSNVWSSISFLTFSIYSLDDYTRRSQGVDEVDMSLLGKLSPLENYLLESQEMMSVRGKVSVTLSS